MLIAFKDWEDHEIRMKDTKKKNMSVKINKTSVAFKMMEKYFTKNVKEGGHVSVQDRLKKATRAEEVAAKSEFDVSKVKKEPEDETEFKAYFDYSEFAEEILLAQSQVKREFKAIVWSSDEEEL